VSTRYTWKDHRVSFTLKGEQTQKLFILLSFQICLSFPIMLRGCLQYNISFNYEGGQISSNSKARLPFNILDNHKTVRDEMIMEY